MRKSLTLAAAALFGLSLSAQADPIYGTWQTIADDNGNYGHIQVRDCGNRGICGTLVRSYNSSGAQIDSEHTGRAIIWDMEAKGGGAYGGGKVYSPDRDRTYNSRLQLSGNSLSVEGCVMGICRDGGTWRRVN